MQFILRFVSRVSSLCPPAPAELQDHGLQLADGNPQPGPGVPGARQRGGGHVARPEEAPGSESPLQHRHGVHPGGGAGEGGTRLGTGPGPVSPS